MIAFDIKKILVMCLASATAFPCGKGLGEVKLGDKIVSIEVKDAKNKSQWIVDDDGMLAISFATAYCNKSVPYLDIDFTQDQKACIDNVQNNIRYDERVSIYSNKGNDRKNALNLKIKDSCGVDVISTITKAEEKRNATPINCENDVKGIISKASKRSEEYLKEQSDPKYLASLNATDVQKQDMLNKLKADVVVSKEANSLFSKSPITVSEFETWSRKFAEVAGNHAYQIQDNPEDKFDPKNQVGLLDILFDVGARVPGLPSSRCGSFPTEIINQLKKAEWKGHNLNSDSTSGLQK